MGVIETGKEIAKLAQQLGSIEIQQKVIELQGEVLAMQEELILLRKNNDELNSTRKIDSELVLRDNAYWRDSAPETRRGPFCKRCWDDKKKLLCLNMTGSGSWFCPTCEKYFETARSEAVMRSRMSAENESALGEEWG